MKDWININTREIVSASEKPEGSFAELTDTKHTGQGDEVELVLYKNGDTATLEYRHFYSSHIPQRAKNYPPLEEQMDMLWHAMDEDESIRIEPWYSTIKQVKDSIPKTG